MTNQLPKAPEAIGNYVTFKKAGNFIYTSGHIPAGENNFFGKIPSQVSIGDGYKAASYCAELTLSTLKENCDIKKIQPLNVVGFINAELGFKDHAKVLNGFTDKLSEFFSEKATRSAVGVQSLPLDVCVEVQCIFIYE
jgi:enamine deaminase RidA (YjgF/YER057c/UK114 family)